jgi:ionotropic glutamate receptor
MIKEEKAVYGQISDEEWEIIRPSKRERRNSILKFMEDNLLTVSVCSNCTTWRVESGEMWGDNYMGISIAEDSSTLVNKKIDTDLRKLTQVGFWKPTNGLQMSDVLFPHVSHGFRGINFHIITYHVR